MNIEQQLYNLKMKVLTIDDMPEHLKEILANDIYLIEESIRAKNNEVLDLVSESCYGVFDPDGELVQLYVNEVDANKEKDELCEANDMKFYVREENII